MYVYLVTFLGGSQTKVRASTPKEACERASNTFKLEAIRVKWLR